MIEEAILALNEKSGSSPYAIGKFMEENHKSVLPANFRKILALQIKNSVSRGKLTKIRASYKLPEAGKKETADGDNGGTARVAKTRSTSKAEAEKKPKEVKLKEARPKKAVTKKTALGVKKAGKSGAAAAPKLKQPRSIKSAGAKRMKVVSAV